MDRCGQNNKRLLADGTASVSEYRKSTGELAIEAHQEGTSFISGLEGLDYVSRLNMVHN